MPDYLLLLQETPADFAHVTPEEMQRIVEAYGAWSDRLAADGRLVQGTKLRDEGGRLLARRGEEISVTDGPYAEAREVIGGLFVIRADDYGHAVRLAGDCPHLAYGRVLVREIDPLDGGAE